MEAVDEIARRIVRAANPVKVVLFGSRARGTAGPWSDIDLLIIENDPVSHWRESARLYALLRDFAVPIDLVVVGKAFADRYGDIPGSIVYAALQEGRVLYG